MEMEIRKGLKIEVVLNNEKMMTAIKRQGFGTTLSDELEVLGILENLKHVQMNKVNNLMQRLR